MTGHSLLGLLIVCAQIFIQPAVAQTTSSVEGEGQTRSKIGEVLREKKFEEDKRITDLELKANAGSLSRYSFKVSLSYSGPPINNLADPYRPDTGRNSGDMRTSMGGSAAFRYRIDSNQAVNFGTGMRWFTPYHAIIGENVPRPNKKAKNYDINDPYVGYDRTYVSGSAQFRSSARVAKTTSEYYVRNGQMGSLGFDQAVKFSLGQSRWVLGTTLSLDYYGFSRNYDPANDGRFLSKYYMTLIPSLEYKISSSLNANTSLGYGYSNLRSDHSWWRWDHPLTTWRLGLGWAIKRDIYFAPYINFYAERPAFNTASASFSTVFSIF